MKQHLVQFCAAFLLVAGVSAETPAGKTEGRVSGVEGDPPSPRPSTLDTHSSSWSTNLEQTVEIARTNGQPLLLYFTASWCGPCRRMAATTFKDVAVQKKLEQFAAVALDLDENPTEAKTRQVTAIPTFLLMSPGGAEVDRHSGYMDPSEFSRWLDKGTMALKTALEVEAAFAQKQESVTQALAGADAAATDKALVDLFELCSHREPAHQKFAQTRLKELAAREPGLLLDGLNHPTLATRIQIANLLREKLGPDFTFDP